MGTEKKNRFRAGDAIETAISPGEDSVADNSVEKEKPKKAERRKKERTVQPEPAARSEKKNGWFGGIRRLYGDERFRKILGLAQMLASVYLALAMVSYFFTWQQDQDKIFAGAAEFFAAETKVGNWLGKFGALVSHWFMFKAFGAASLVLVPVLFIYGLHRLLQRRVVQIGNFTAKWLFMMVWGSLTLSTLFSDHYFFMGGGFGFFIGEVLVNYVGVAGLSALLAFTMLAFLVIVFNWTFKMPVHAQAAEEQQIEEEIRAVVGGNTARPVLHDEPKLSEEEEAAMLDFQVHSREDDSYVEIQDSEVKPAVDAAVDLPLDVPLPGEDKGAAGPELEITAPVEEQGSIEGENKAAELVEQFGEYDPTLDLGSYVFPAFDLLNDYGNIHSKVNQDELIANKNRILGTLKNYGIEIDKISATVGPTVTLYEIVPAAGVRISKIKNLEDDIALSLAALGIRIIAPIPGKGTIGIEVPNMNPEMVPMRNILASEKFNNSQFELPIALGKTISNEIYIADLAKMPHLLMAGATGQGKSVGLNAVLVSLLYKKHPSQVKFVLVDPKKVELTLFNKIERHFLAKLPNSEEAIITDNTRVIHTLNSLCIEMDNRYALLQDAHVRNIKEYNAKFVQRKLNPNDGHKFLPYIVLVVDEFADLIMTAGKEVETPIARLAQLARAVGIHLIIATQRPSVNIITGTIKANFPARIAFRVTSKIDSRTILDSGGADQLIGRGDMLLSTGNDLIRIQCAFVDTPEVEKITEFIGNQRAYPSAFLLPEYVGEDGGGGKEDIDLSERDKMFDEAARLVVQFQQGSASFLQRKLKLGYNRAGRIVDQLEAAGVIGPFEGSKAREVLISDMAALEEVLQKVKNGSS